jgi:hypothetical protein
VYLKMVTQRSFNFTINTVLSASKAITANDMLRVNLAWSVREEKRVRERDEGRLILLAGQQAGRMRARLDGVADGNGWLTLGHGATNDRQGCSGWGSEP